MTPLAAIRRLLEGTPYAVEVIDGPCATLVLSDIIVETRKGSGMAQENWPYDLLTGRLPAGDRGILLP